MRPALAVLLALAFAALFIAALVVSRVADTAGDPAVMTSVLDDADVYDFFYDRVIDSILRDVTTGGIAFDSGFDDTVTIEFEDPERVRTALATAVSQLLPREYLREKVIQTLDGVLPYASGQTDEFQVDLETNDRIRQLPAVVRDISADIELGELLTSEVVTTVLREYDKSVTSKALGFSLTSDEISEAARAAFPPEWIEDTLFDVTAEVASYLSGESDQFEVTIPLRDRVRAVGEVLKGKLQDDDAVSRFVFGKVINPIVSDALDRVAVLAFNVELSDENVEEALELVAPDDLVRERGAEIIDSAVAWLVGDTDSFTIILDMRQWKANAIPDLEALAFRLAEERVALTPICRSGNETAVALSQLVTGTFPTCLPDQTGVVLSQMRPLIASEVRSYISSRVPDEVVYTDVDFRASLSANSADSLDELRRVVIRGFKFSETDLLELLAVDGSEQSYERAEDIIRVVRTGVSFDHEDIPDLMTDATFEQFEQFRDRAGTAWSLRFVVFLPALVVLVGVAITGGYDWRTRALWSGSALGGTAALFFVALTVGWSLVPSIEQLNVDITSISDGDLAQYPHFTSLLQHGELTDLALRIGGSWVEGLAFSALPWVLVGFIVAGLAWAFPSYRRYLPAARPLDPARGNIIRPVQKPPYLEPSDPGAELKTP